MTARAVCCLVIYYCYSSQLVKRVGKVVKAMVSQRRPWKKVNCRMWAVMAGMQKLCRDSFSIFGSWVRGQRGSR